jgi:hypothetical protein
MTDEQRSEALELLRDPRLLERVLEDFDRAGVVGEEKRTSSSVTSQRSLASLKAPLAVVIQSFRAPRASRR